mgnify:FL=1
MIQTVKDFFDLPIETRERISEFKNGITEKYKVNDVGELILFHLCKQYCADGYSELDLDYLFGKLNPDRKEIVENADILFQKEIIGYRIRKGGDKIYLKDDIIKNFDDNFEEGFSNTNDKNIIDFLKENEESEDFEIIDMNTNKKVSIQECVDLMIKNSSIYNDREEM